MSRNAVLRRSMLNELLDGEPLRKKQKIAPLSTLLLDAQRALDDARYKDAAQYLTSIIEGSVEKSFDLLHIYELRCRASIGSKAYEDALKDAKQMIRLDRGDIRGYLRCAKVEQLKGNTPAAMKACEYGLKSVHQSARHYSKLEALLNRIKEVSASHVVLQKGTDPMTSLPNELLDMVLTSFDYRQYVAVLRVSKTWRSRLKQLDVLSRSIDLRQSKRTLTYEQLKAAFSRLNKCPKSIGLMRLNENAARLANSELSNWIKWETLEDLVLDDGKLHISRLRWDKLPNLRHLEIGYGLTLPDNFSSILKTCASLDSMSLRGSISEACFESIFDSKGITKSSLRDLRIIPARPINIYMPPTCVFPDLERLDLGGIMINGNLNLSSYPKLRDLKLMNAIINDRYNLRTPTSLESFTLRGPFADTYPNPAEIKMPAEHLRTIIVEGSDSIRFLAYAIRQGLDKNSLRYLCMRDFVQYGSIGGRPITSDLSLLESMSTSTALENVEVLTLHDNNIFDNTATTIAKIFPNVIHFDIEAPSITEAFISEIVRTSGKRLQTIRVRNSVHISESIVKWCQLRNIDLKLLRRSWQDDSLGGKQVRY